MANHPSCRHPAQRGQRRAWSRPLTHRAQAGREPTARQVPGAGDLVGRGWADPALPSQNTQPMTRCRRANRRSPPYALQVRRQQPWGLQVLKSRLGMELQNQWDLGWTLKVENSEKVKNRVRSAKSATPELRPALHSSQVAPDSPLHPSPLLYVSVLTLGESRQGARNGEKWNPWQMATKNSPGSLRLPGLGVTTLNASRAGRRRGGVKGLWWPPTGPWVVLFRLDVYLHVKHQCQDCPAFPQQARSLIRSHESTGVMAAGNFRTVSSYSSGKKTA